MVAAGATKVGLCPMEQEDGDKKWSKNAISLVCCFHHSTPKRCLGPPGCTGPRLIWDALVCWSLWAHRCYEYPWQQGSLIQHLQPHFTGGETEAQTLIHQK